MAAKPNIEKIVFNVHGKKLELTADEAKELKQILSDLFGETKVVHERHTWPHYQWPYAIWSSGILSGTISGYSNTPTVTSGEYAASDTVYLTV